MLCIKLILVHWPLYSYKNRHCSPSHVSYDYPICCSWLHYALQISNRLFRPFVLLCWGSFAISFCHKKNWPLFWQIFYIAFFKSIGVDRGMRQCKLQSVVVTTVTRARSKLRRSSDIPRPLLHSLECVLHCSGSGNIKLWLGFLFISKCWFNKD